MGGAKQLPSRLISRVLFAALEDRLVILHGFIKKTPATPDPDMALARRRKKELE